jgi:hypothetical protein
MPSKSDSDKRHHGNKTSALRHAQELYDSYEGSGKEGKKRIQVYYSQDTRSWHVGHAKKRGFY